MSCIFFQPFGRETIKDIINGLAVVEKDGKYGYINESGETVIPSQYDYAKSFYDDTTAVVIDGKWGFIDLSGEMVVPCQFDYDYVKDFCDGLAAVEKDGKWGFIDFSGDLVIPCQFNHVQSFQEGLAAVEKDGKWGFINSSGELVIPFQFNHAYFFFEGLAKVEKDGKCGFVDTSGDVVGSFDYQSIGGRNYNNLAIVMKDDKYQILDLSGNSVKIVLDGIQRIESDGIVNVPSFIEDIDMDEDLIFADGKVYDRRGKILSPESYHLETLNVLNSDRFFIATPVKVKKGTNPKPVVLRLVK